MTIPLISDEFTSRTGTLKNFDNLLGIRASDPASLGPFAAPTNGLPVALLNRHIDIRGFLDNEAVRATTMLELSNLHMAQNADTQILAVTSLPNAGTFTVNWTDENDNETGRVFLYNATSFQIATGLSALTGLDVMVTGTTFPYSITFPTSATYIPLLLVDSDLTSGGIPVDVTVNIAGTDFFYIQTASIPDPSKTQDQLGFLATIRSENWRLTAGEYDNDDIEVGPINTYNNWRGIRLTFDSTRNLGTMYLNSNTYSTPINLKVLESNIANMEISMPIPGITSLPLNLTQCSIQFTSEGLGRFDLGADSEEVVFQGNIVDVSGYVEFKADVTAFNNTHINWTSVTGVRIKLTGTGATPVGQFVLLGIRAFSKLTAWVPTSLDINTVTERLATPVTKNGNPNVSSYSPLPPILRANLAVPSGVEDPRPSDTSLSVRFHTGSLATNSAPYNKVQLIFRENEFTAQHAEWMVAELQFGKDYIDLKRYMVKRTESGGNYTDQILGGVSDTLQSAATAPAINSRPASGTFAPLKPDTNYLLQGEVINNGFRVGISEMDSNGIVNFTHYETSFEYRPEWVRRAGRVGFYGTFPDKDISLEYFRNSSTAFSIFRTAIFRSRTPVDGAQLWVSSSGPKQLFNEFLPVKSNDQVNIDSTKNPEANSITWRVTSAGTENFAGIRSNPMYFEDFDNTAVEFDIWLPGDMTQNIGKKPQIYFLDPTENGDLGGASLIGPVDIQATSSGFTHNRISLSLFKFKPVGLYEILFVSETPYTTQWWIANMRVNRRTVAWEFRAKSNSEWIPFKDMLNDDRFGLHLGRQLRGVESQLQARALTQDAWIAEYRLVPRYAQLGLIRSHI